MKYLNFTNLISSNSKPELIMTLIDSSGSMGNDDWKPTRKEGAIKANIELIKTKARLHPQDKMGIIGFNSNATLLHHLICIGENTESLTVALNNTLSQGSTNFIAALELAEDCLFSESPPQSSNLRNRNLLRAFSELFYEPASDALGKKITEDGITRRIIMLTDGDHTDGGQPESVAKRLKNTGVVIDCIGIGGTPKDVDEDMLKTIASRNPDGSIRYCFIGNQQSLLRKYETLARHIRPV